MVYRIHTIEDLEMNLNKNSLATAVDTAKTHLSRGREFLRILPLSWVTSQDTLPNGILGRMCCTMGDVHDFIAQYLPITCDDIQRG